MLLRDIELSSRRTNEYWERAEVVMSDGFVLVVARHSTLHPHRQPDYWRLYEFEHEPDRRHNADSEFEAQMILDHYAAMHGGVRYFRN